MTNAELTPQMNSILELCLAAIQSGEKTLADCLAQFPEHASWLKTELQAALLLSRLQVPDMPAASVNALENRLMQRFDRVQGEQKPANNIVRFPGFFAGKAAAVLVLILLMGLAGTGTVAASAYSKPGDSLYTIKRAWEDLIAMLATIIGQSDEVWLHLTQERAGDVMYLVENASLNPDALNDFTLALENAILYADDSTTAALVNFMQMASTTLPPVAPDESLAGDYQRVQMLLTPRYDETGRLTLLDTNLPDVIPVAATSTPTTMPPEIITETTVPSMTPLPSLTPTNTEQPTRTPRFAPTATRTPALPTETPLPTLTETPFVPTATWTPIDLPNGFATRTPVPQTDIIDGNGNRVTVTPGNNVVQPIFLRETERAVFATQTAIAEDNFGTPDADAAE